MKGHDVDHCIRCGGTFLEKGKENLVLGKTASQDMWKESEICERKTSQQLVCPKDYHTLNTYQVAFEDTDVEVDLCPDCEGLWLDPHEGKKLLDIVLHAGQEKSTTFSENPGIKSYLFQAFSGMPVEAWNPVHHRPILTLCLISLLIIMFALQLGFQQINDFFTLVPTEFLAGKQSWTLITTGFLHGSLPHILGNLYFLYIFGDNVEDHIGRLRFTILYFSALILSTLSFTLLRSELDNGLVGASGAIAGLMGAYMALFPNVKLYFTVFFIPIRLGVSWYLAFWLAFNTFMMLFGVGGVAWSAHIAGFITGITFGMIFQFTSIRDHIQGK